MNKFRLFIENIFIYGFGSIIGRIIPVFMVPIVISLMPTTDYYGLHDLFISLTLIASSIATVGIYDAMYRMYFEKDDEEYRKRVCSTAFRFNLLTSIAAAAAMILLKDIIAEFFFKNKGYAYIIYIAAATTFAYSVNNVISAPTRMQNKGKVFIVTNLLLSLISYSTAIPMLLAGYYTVAMPLAVLISSLAIVLIFFMLNRSWFDLKIFDKKLLKEMLVIALPLLPNYLVYWLFNSSDKLMITNMIGLGAAGIYAVGSKFGYVSHLIYTAFNGGWQFFAFSTMKEEGQVKQNSLVFEYLGAISFACTFFVCALSYPLFCLFKAEYLSGYIIVPYLFLAPLLQMLFQVAGNQFLVIKKTVPSMLILCVGAAVNILLNLVMIPKAGIEGAAAATLFGYMVSNIICAAVLCKMKLMTISGRFFLTFGLSAVYFVMWRLFYSDKTLIGLALAVLFSCGIALLYKTELRFAAGRLKGMIGKRRKSGNGI